MCLLIHRIQWKKKVGVFCYQDNLMFEHVVVQHLQASSLLTSGSCHCWFLYCMYSCWTWEALYFKVIITLFSIWQKKCICIQSRKHKTGWALVVGAQRKGEPHSQEDKYLFCECKYLSWNPAGKSAFLGWSHKGDRPLECTYCHYFCARFLSEIYHYHFVYHHHLKVQIIKYDF